MKQYRATITGDRFPLDFTVEATSWPTAVSRATRAWQKRFKGNRTPTLTIRIVKL
jgi:hypothetical protein